jgi:hypothetical protein
MIVGIRLYQLERSITVRMNFFYSANCMCEKAFHESIK